MVEDVEMGHRGADPGMSEQGVKGTVLVVDDELALVRVLALHLESVGYNVLTATSGTEALAHIRQDRPDVVVLDAMMPEMSGLEVCRRVRTDASLSDAHVIILTANAGFRESSQEVGADAFMTKPFSLADLTAEVDRLNADKPPG
ncbi:MAG: two-component system, OmpR family, alkaline phosphatase synthesis response regulator PhoP [Chloroflexota bacterium]|jgi:two-component system phosphate regulon response regulator PhoB|nr:two-component system, OmpR family, alkaline phosphatase synthesis response regulator PhoP [Chloroflexota bacterium]